MPAARIFRRTADGALSFRSLFRRELRFKFEEREESAPKPSAYGSKASRLPTCRRGGQRPLALREPFGALFSHPLVRAEERLTSGAQGRDTSC